jgi:hypothetical protein
MKRDKIEAILKLFPVPAAALVLVFPLTGYPGQSETQAPDGGDEAAQQAPPASDAPPPAATSGQKKSVSPPKSKGGINTELISGTLPIRKTSAGAFLALGFVGPSGFLLGGDFYIGWKLVRFVSLHLKVGAGYVQKRSGVNSTLAHFDVTFPVRLAICSHTPRVCPGLDFYLSLIPGVGYGVLIPNKSPTARELNHAINAIVGIALESLRTYGNMDAGVRFGIYVYIDFLKDNEKSDPWLAYAIFELGVVIRWGKPEKSS